MAGIERPQQIHNLLATAFPQHHPVGAHAQRGFHQIGKAHRTFAFNVRFPRRHGNMIPMAKIDKLPHLFHGDDTVIRITLRKQRLCQGGLAHAGTASNQHGGSLAHQPA